MTITLRIDRIVLDGVPLSPRDITGLRDALRAELADLLAGSRPARRSVHQAHVAGTPVICPPERIALGHKIARSIHGAVCQGPHR
jgi:hypothetical protein